jgi:GDP-L-fucose synthase
LGALISKIILAKKENKDKVTIWGPGSPIREWLYVEDAAQSIINAIDIDPYQDIINVGKGSGISIKDLAFLIKDLSGWGGDFIFDKTKTDGAPIKVLDGEKGESLLKMKDFKSFEDGMRETIDFYISITKS